MKTLHITDTTTIKPAWSEPAPAHCSEFERFQGPGRLVFSPPNKRRDQVGLSIGHWEGSTAEGVINDIQIDLNTLDAPIRNGLEVHGVLTAEKLSIWDPRGDELPDNGSASGLTESFGLRIVNPDAYTSFECHGGSWINDLDINIAAENSYVTAICVAQRSWPGQRLEWSWVGGVEVRSARWSHAALTALERVHFQGGYSFGTRNFFNCDTGLCDEVIIEDWHAEVGRTACRLAVGPDGLAKRNVIFRNCTFVFKGPGPHYAAELFDETDKGLIDNIVFDSCTFLAPRGGEFYDVSHIGVNASPVQFKNCVLPLWTKSHHPNWK